MFVLHLNENIFKRFIISTICSWFFFEVILKFGLIKIILEYVHMRGEMNSKRYGPKWNLKPAWSFHVNIILPKRNEYAQTRWMLRLMRMCVWNSMRVWISYRSLWQKWNFISGDKISCKHYLKWNAYTCPSKYRVILKCSRNET